MHHVNALKSTHLRVTYTLSTRQRSLRCNFIFPASVVSCYLCFVISVIVGFVDMALNQMHIYIGQVNVSCNVTICGTSLYYEGAHNVVLHFIENYNVLLQGFLKITEPSIQIHVYKIFFSAQLGRFTISFVILELCHALNTAAIQSYVFTMMKPSLSQTSEAHVLTHFYSF